MEEFLKRLQGKSIHLVGVTGAEGSSILQFLLKHNLTGITVHDFLEDSVEKSFKLWHKGISIHERNKLFQEFTHNLEKVRFFTGEKYLSDITSADIIFVPQSWRLYRQRNKLLWKAKQKGIPFYSLTRMYLDFAKATIVGVTGTVGKGSVTHMLFQLLSKCGKDVYVAGNDTWRLQLGEKIDEMRENDILLLEISHRQLQDGFTKAPHIVVFTNLYPNHLDELSWKDYQDVKFSLSRSQKANDFSILNYDVPELRHLGAELKSNVIYFSVKNKEMNTKNVQKLYDTILGIKSAHFLENILAAAATSFILGLNNEHVIQTLPTLSSLPARLEYIGEMQGITFYDDMKSTTPYATLAAIKRLSSAVSPVLLIAGGRTKGITYDELVKEIKRLKHTILLRSELSELVTKNMSPPTYTVVDTLSDGVHLAYQKAHTGDNILLSPAAGFFYSDFIKGKSSFRKVVTSLLPKEQE